LKNPSLEYWRELEEHVLKTDLAEAKKALIKARADVAEERSDTRLYREDSVNQTTATWSVGTSDQGWYPQEAYRIVSYRISATALNVQFRRAYIEEDDDDDDDDPNERKNARVKICLQSWNPQQTLLRAKFSRQGTVGTVESDRSIDRSII